MIKCKFCGAKAWKSGRYFVKSRHIYLARFRCSECDKTFHSSIIPLLDGAHKPVISVCTSCGQEVKRA